MTDLPVFIGSPDPHLYHGETPQYSQNVQYDQNGGLLFFVIDGRVYDREGYMIADDRGTVDCEDCLFRGISQVGIILVPGSCTQYFLVAADYQPQQHALGYSILDMEQPNRYWPTRLGRVLSYDDVTNDPGLTAQFANAFQTMPLWSVHSNGDFDASDRMINLDDLQPLLYGYEHGLHLAIYDTDRANEQKLLFAVDESYLCYYKILAGGIDRVNSLTTAQPLNSQTSVFGSGTRRDFVGGCAFKRTGNDPNDPVLFAMSATSLSQTSGPVPSVILFQVDFALNTVEWLQDVTTCQLTGPDLNITGLVFSPNADHLYVAQSETPWLNTIDLGTYAVTDVATSLGVANPQQFSGATLSIDNSPLGGSDALIALSASRTAFKTQPDQPTLTGSWNEPIPVTATLGARPTFIFQDGATPSCIPDMHNQGEQQIATLNSEVCCVYRNSLLAIPGYSITGQPTWTATNNPWGNTPEVTFDQDVTIETGANVLVTGMTWRFSENARLIIERGAKATFNTCTLTSYSCIGERWPGVRVEGTTADDVQHQGAQGRLTLSNSSAIENAVTGVWCAREVTPGIADPDYYGGWVKAYNSIFRNCNTGVRIERYVRRNSNNDEVHNLCLFSNCTFINDLDWPIAAGSPVAMAYLYDVNGVFFGDCEFRNEAYTLMADPDLRGVGIVSWESTFTCHGNMDYSLHGFRNLTSGVLTWDADPLFLSEVDGMDFVNNKFGLIDFGSDDGVYTNNQLATLTTDALNGETSIGLYLIQSERYTVERNLFTKPSGALAPGAGIWFRGPAYENNRIYDNTFNDLNAGCVIQGDHVANVPSGQGNTLDGLQMLCGDHTGNYVDQMILLDGYIKENQGSSETIETLAGNRFFSSVDCDGNGVPDPSFEPWVFPGHAQDLHVDYFHHDGMLSPASEPECVIGSWIDTYYDLILPFPYSGVAFDKDAHCDDGDLEFTNGGDHLQLLVDYNAKILEVASTLANYQGIVDNGELPDLITAIRYQPWHPSHYLRDLLLAKQPLSDEVMLEAIARPEPLDPWHLTQILIDNSPVTDDIWLALDASGALPPYFYGLLQQFSAGMSTRRLLEMELIRRKEEKAILQHRLLVAINTDTTLTGTTALIDSIFMADSLGRGTRYRYQLALHREDFSSAAALEELFHEEADASRIVQLGQLRSALAGNWHAATAGQRDDLLELAYAADVQASAHAWAVSMAIGETDSLPDVYLPLAYRSASFAPKLTQRSAAQPLLQALPNPTHGQVVLTYPKEFTEGTITVLDVQGKVVAQHSITGHRAMLELDLEHLSPGLYIARLEAEGIPVGEVKISVVK